MDRIFEWDHDKAESNRTKHGVDFEEASSAFGDPLSLTVPDPEHSAWREERQILIGRSSQGRMVVVVHAERGDKIRIISARLASPRERRVYEED